jgi:hypothetical protein
MGRASTRFDRGLFTLKLSSLCSCATSGYRALTELPAKSGKPRVNRSPQTLCATF